MSISVDIADPATASTDQPNKLSAPASPAAAPGRPRWQLLVVALVVLLVISWLTDVPARIGCGLAQAALRRHQPHQALRWIDRSLQWSRDARQPLLLAVRANLQLNKSQTAALVLEQAAQRGAPVDLVVAYRQMVAAQSGDSQAIAELLASQNELALPPEAYEAVVRGYQLTNNLQRADLVLDELQRSGAVPGIVHYLKGRNCEIRDDQAGAVVNYRQALQVTPDSARVAFRAGCCLARQRYFDQAAEMYLLLQTAVPYHTIAAIEGANCLWEQGQIAPAAALIEPALTIAPEQLQSLYLELDEYVDNDRAAIIAARIYDATADSQRVVPLLQRVLAYNHRDFEARTLLIKHLRLLKREAEADQLALVQNQMVLNRQRCRQIRQQLDSDPDNIPLRCELAELYWETESEAETRLMLQEILELDPKCQRALAFLQQINAPTSAANQIPSSSAAQP